MGNYDDLLDLPHHVSAVRPPMPVSERAAQFSPFAALTGFEDRVSETARITEDEIFLAEDQKELLDRRLAELSSSADPRPLLSFTIFQPDARKSGGSFREISGRIKKIDRETRSILLEDQTRLAIDAILDIRETAP